MVLPRAGRARLPAALGLVPFPATVPLLWMWGGGRLWVAPSPVQVPRRGLPSPLSLLCSVGHRLAARTEGFGFYTRGGCCRRPGEATCCQVARGAQVAGRQSGLAIGGARFRRLALSLVSPVTLRRLVRLNKTGDNTTSTQAVAPSARVLPGALGRGTRAGWTQTRADGACRACCVDLSG